VKVVESIQVGLRRVRDATHSEYVFTGRVARLIPERRGEGFERLPRVVLPAIEPAVHEALRLCLRL
jgi:hypothetical protein